MAFAYNSKSNSQAAELFGFAVEATFYDKYQDIPQAGFLRDFYRRVSFGDGDVIK